MTESPKINLMGNNDPLNVDQPGKNNKMVFSIPGPERPLVCKLIYDHLYSKGKNSYVSVTQCRHSTGPRETDVGYHTLLNTFGEDMTPEIDNYWEHKKLLSALRKEGKGDTLEAKKAEKIINSLYPSDKAWFYFVEPESSLIRAVRVPISITNRMFGKKATQNRPEVPSLLKEMAKRGLSPYDVTKTDGWIKIYKTGVGKATVYHVELAETEEERMIEGGKAIVKKCMNANVHEKIRTSDVQLSDFPDVLAFERQHSFTRAESETWIASGFTVIPSKFAKRADNSVVDETSDTPDAPESDAAATMKIEDIPF